MGRFKKKYIGDRTFYKTVLLFNEFLWAAGMAFIAQCYSVRGLYVVGAKVTEEKQA